MTLVEGVELVLLEVELRSPLAKDGSAVVFVDVLVIDEAELNDVGIGGDPVEELEEFDEGLLLLMKISWDWKQRLK